MVSLGTTKRSAAIYSKTARKSYCVAINNIDGVYCKGPFNASIGPGNSDRSAWTSYSKVSLVGHVAIHKEYIEAVSRHRNIIRAYSIIANYDIKDNDELEKIQQDNDIPKAMLEARRLSAGWIVDQLDLKGKKIGDAMISEEHGNFIINSGSATASDIIQLISLIKMKARERYGIQLQEEVQLVGFWYTTNISLNFSTICISSKQRVQTLT